jgi:hypothetical protein
VTSNRGKPDQTVKTVFSKRFKDFVVMSDKTTWVEAGKESVKAQRYKGNLSFTL